MASAAERQQAYRDRRAAELAQLRGDARGRPGDSFVKACFAVAQAAAVHSREPSQFLRDDRVAELILTRANAAPGMTTTAGWGLELATVAFRDFLTGLGPYGAAARLIAQAVRAEASPYDAVKYPVRAAGPVAPAWVAEGDAIPVRSAAFTNISIGPARKLCHIIPFSRELSKRSDAERIFATMLSEDVAAGIDAAFLATTAATTAAPAGLLNGVTPLAGFAGGDLTAIETDFGALAAAVATGGSGAVTFIVAPERLARLRILAPLLAQSLDIVASAACPVNRVIAVEGPALLIAVDERPDIMRSEEGVLHMSDVPLELVPDSGVASDPLRSLFQSASAALRLVHEIAFTKRRAGCVSYLDNASW